MLLFLQGPPGQTGIQGPPGEQGRTVRFFVFEICCVFFK